jgi:hypothetical protein
MGKNMFVRKPNALLVLIFSGLFFQGCGILGGRVTTEDDIVYASKRTKWEYVYNNLGRISPLLSLNQSIVKETNANKVTSYTVYDIVNLSDASFALENKVFMIIDSDVFPMKIETKELVAAKTLEEKRADVVKADSTKVSVVTGYAENNKTIVKFKYKLNENIMSRLQSAERVLFRYYAGPDMITVELKGIGLGKLKKAMAE